MHLFVPLRIGVFMLLVCSSAGSAESAESLEHQHGSHSECPLPKSATDVVRCAALHHPSVKRAKIISSQSAALVDVASQVPNPEIDVESTIGPKDGGNASSTEVGILQPIEWGGRRSSRIASAQAESGRLGAEETDTTADVIRETVRNLHRLRQLDIEKSFLIDTIETLKKIITQQSGRPALTPEQQVTLSVYRMALADAKIKESEVFEEERQLEHYFHVSTGHSLSELRPVLPSAPEKWPSISDAGSTSDASPGLKRALADRDFSQAQLSVAKSQTWPQLKFGPLIKSERNETQSQNLYGFRLMMDLPIFNRNGAGRSHANAVLANAETLIQLTRSEENHERSEQLKVYRSAVEALKAAPPVASIEKDFLRNQNFARRGLVSGALLIELHRQRSELIRSRNLRELKAIESLWLINKFDGRIFSEKP